jgi:hypothetical protein
MKFNSFQRILLVMLGVTSLSTFLLVFQTPEEWPQWSDDGEATSREMAEGVLLRTSEESPKSPLPSMLETLTLERANPTYSRPQTPHHEPVDKTVRNEGKFSCSFGCLPFEVGFL